MTEPGHFDAKRAILQQQTSLQGIVATVIVAALAMGVIALAAGPGMHRTERAYQNARV